MKILDRRSALLSSYFLYINPRSHPLSISDTARLIITQCPASFRRAVRDSGGAFLYRGGSSSTFSDKDSVDLQSPIPDLLQWETYQSQQAVDFFMCLEDALPESVVRPSVGHIGTSNIRVAKQWGTPAVSVWPLCHELSYLWPINEELIYLPNDCQLSRFCINQELEVALIKGKEVLFASQTSIDEEEGSYDVTPCSFLSCPSQYDKELKRLLSQNNYGL